MRRLAWLPAVLACTVALALPAGEAPRPVAFFAEARVEVDADGKVVKVDAAQDLPASIRTYIEQELKTWQYARRGDHAEGPASGGSFVDGGGHLAKVVAGLPLMLRQPDDFDGGVVHGPGLRQTARRMDASKAGHHSPLPAIQ